MSYSWQSSLDHDHIVNPVRGDKKRETISSSIIKVIGVGGGGGNAVNYMFEKKIKDVEFAICNTDRQALMKSPVPSKIQLGAKLTKGLGAGTDARNGREAALENIDEIKEMLGGNTQMVFITAGMGGGTGTGAAPVIAKTAKEMGMLTVAVVTAPYTWEGMGKKEQAMEGIRLLQDYSDTVLVVLNDKLEELFADMTQSQAFAEADNILLNAVKSIAEIITTKGNINTDFKDVERVLKDAGQSVMGTADANGSDRALKAISQALDSPLLNDRDITGAQRILVTMASSNDKEATVKEQRIITHFVTEQIKQQPDLFKLGTIIDDTLGDTMRVTILAAGFESQQLPIDIPLKPKEHKAETSAPYRKLSSKPFETHYEDEEMAEEYDFEKTFTGGPKGWKNQPDLESAHHGESYNEHALSNEVDAWSPDESARIKEMIKRFQKGAYNWSDLEAPAFKRSHLELWKRPRIEASEFEQHRLE